MSGRDGVDDLDYDELRGSGLSREQCWAILGCSRNPLVVPPPNAAKNEANRRQSGVRMPPVGPPPGGPGPPSP